MSAAISAMPRWVTALILADGATFPWFDSNAWKIISIIAAMAFAVVETYAAAYIMSAWRSAQKQPKTNLRNLWVAILALLTIIMAPAIYANTFHSPFADLSKWIQIGWSVCVAVSTFLVVGGVGYAENFMAATRSTKNDDVITRIKNFGNHYGERSDKFNTYIAVSKSMTPAEMVKEFQISLSTAYNWQNKKLAMVSN